MPSSFERARKNLHQAADKIHGMVEKIRTADAVVIGGGVAGLSTALQLARRGQRVVVVERAQLGSGSSGRAAGLLGQLRGTTAATRMLIDALEIVRDLSEQAESEIFVETGSLRIAETPDRSREIVDLVAMGKSIGFEIEHVDATRVAELVPYMKTDALIDACYCPTDGHVQPAELVAAYIKVGKRHGVEYLTNSPVEEVILKESTAIGVRAGGVEFHAPVIVNAAGPWSYLVADLTETHLPTSAIGHYYLTTRPHPDVTVDRLSPAVRDRHHRIYTRAEAGGLIVGMYEEEPAQYDMENLSADFDMTTMHSTRNDINVAMLIHSANQRFPWIDEKTPMTVTTGIMTFTPDGKPLCGQLPDVEGLYHCSGFSGHGIVQSPTIGVIMAELILDGGTRYDVEAIQADRYFDVADYRDRAAVKSACYAMYSSYYGRIETPER